MFATPLRWNRRYGSQAVAAGVVTLEVLQVSKRCASDPAWERNPGVGSAPRARWEAQSFPFCNASAVEWREFRRLVISDAITLEVLQIPIRRCSHRACGAKSLFDVASHARRETHPVHVCNTYTRHCINH